MDNVYDLLMRGDGIRKAPPEPEEVLNAKAVGNKSLGDIITLGGRQYIVLGREDGGVAVITKGIVKCMVFGRTGDYRNSAVRRFCIEEFYRELVNVVGTENILMHAVDLTADDGTGVEFCDDYVSLITAERYRRYRRWLPALGKWWWTATRVSADNDSYARTVCYIHSDGVLSWNFSVFEGGVRPFCILNPALLLD